MTNCVPLLSDEERLSMLEAFSGVNSVRVQTDKGQFSALFNRDFAIQNMTTGEIEGYVPTLVCIDSDVKRLELAKDISLTVIGEGDYRIKTVAARDRDLGPGFTRLYLKL